MTSFSEHLGVEITTGDGEARATVQIEQRHLNGAGTVHGGFLATLSDTVMGSAVDSTTGGGERPATVSLTVTYLQPPCDGPLTAHGTLTRRGKRITIAEAEITDAEGNVAATAVGTFVLV